MSQHERRLDRIIRNYGIESSYNDTTTAHRYVAVLVEVIDGEQPAAKSFDRMADALDWLATGRDNDPPRDPGVLVDLDTNRYYALTVTTVVSIDDSRPPVIPRN
jgi:hypothetical protein